ncbi:MAG: phasin family protein [Leptolyngbyaceae cyanobacterium]
MAGFGNLVQKAFYLGVGLASYAGEKTGDTLKDAREQAQKIVNELVERGELTAEEAQKLLNNMMQQAQTAPAAATDPATSEPRKIEILEDEPTAEEKAAEALRQQVETLRQQLNNLKG